MNLDELRAVQVEERKTDSLQPLRESFYADVAAFIAGLCEERERAAAGVDDPFAATDVRELSDEIETAEEVVEAIYERRVGKVVKRASLAAAGIPTDEDGLTAEEVDLFEALVADIEANRRTVLDVLAGDDTAPGAGPENEDRSDSTEAAGTGTASGPTDDEPAAPEPPPEERVFDAGEAVSDPVDPTGSSSPEASHPESEDDMTATNSTATAADDQPNDATTPASSDETEPNTDRVPVRITQDVGEILGIDDHTYTLAENDVVTLPTANAEPLLERDAAERLDDVAQP